MGHDMALKAINERKASLLVFASDASPRLVEEMKRAGDRCCPAMQCIILDETMNELHMSLGYKSGVLTVNDINFSTRITELVNQEEKAYGN